jgi:hypothetical protein
MIFILVFFQLSLVNWKIHMKSQKNRKMQNKFFCLPCEQTYIFSKAYILLSYSFCMKI